MIHRIPRLGACILLTAATFFIAVAPSFAVDARQNKINHLTRQLQNLPERAAPSSQVSSLVKALTKLQPDHTGQYYSLGLRKLGLPGASGEAFAKRLNDQLQALVANSDLSKTEKDSMRRRLNKTERLFVPVNPEPTPTPYQAILTQRTAMSCA